MIKMNYAARTLLSFFSFNIGWWACALGASHGYPWIGPASLPVFIGLHLYFTPVPKGEALFLALLGVIGFGIDSVLMKVQFFTIDGAEFAPLWLVAMWVLMGQTYESMLMMRRNMWLLSLSGAFSGPLSYYCFEALNLLTYARPLWLSLAAHAVLWAALTPIFFWLREKAVRLAGFTPTVLVQPAADSEMPVVAAADSHEDRQVLEYPSAARSHRDKP